MCSNICTFFECIRELTYIGGKGMFLSKPSIIYRQSYINALREFHMEGRNLRYYVNELEDNFHKLVTQLKSREHKDKLVIGNVPESVFWLVDDNKFIGRVSVRHILNERLLQCGGNIGYEIRPLMRKKGYGLQILKLGLIEAKKIGLEKVLLTCSSTNIASKLIIEKNGGVFEDSRYIENEKDITLRYWIRL